jgi:hypothetical protein
MDFECGARELYSGGGCPLSDQNLKLLALHNHNLLKIIELLSVIISMNAKFTITPGLH